MNIMTNYLKSMGIVARKKGYILRMCSMATKNHAIAGAGDFRLKERAQN